MFSVETPKVSKPRLVPSKSSDTIQQLPFPLRKRIQKKMQSKIEEAKSPVISLDLEEEAKPRRRRLLHEKTNSEQLPRFSTVSAYLSSTRLGKLNERNGSPSRSLTARMRNTTPFENYLLEEVREKKPASYHENLERIS